MLVFSSQTELIMEAMHKQRSSQFKKTMDAKKNYEQKCRDKDDAEQAVHRSASQVNPKQQEKVPGRADCLKI